MEGFGALHSIMLVSHEAEESRRVGRLAGGRVRGAGQAAAAHALLAAAAAFMLLAAAAAAAAAGAAAVGWRDSACQGTRTPAGMLQGCEQAACRQQAHLSLLSLLLFFSPSSLHLPNLPAPACPACLPRRDLADAAGAERACSIECCGHEPRTVITAMAFQPDGPLLVRVPAAAYGAWQRGGWQRGGWQRRGLAAQAACRQASGWPRWEAPSPVGVPAALLPASPAPAAVLVPAPCREERRLGFSPTPLPARLPPGRRLARPPACLAGHRQRQRQGGSV